MKVVPRMVAPMANKLSVNGQRCPNLSASNPNTSAPNGRLVSVNVVTITISSIALIPYSALNRLKESVTRKQFNVFASQARQATETVIIPPCKGNRL